MTTVSSMVSATSAAPTATASHKPNSNGNDSGGRPLLFFVALGFGVVFTNLWIIVGVKYCFRYNNRHRRGQIDAETGEPIDLNNITRPRRRREKKLMSMDEVNERFPLTKYKIWRATREQEGLPTAGGVNVPPSRAGSIKETMLERTSTEGDLGNSFAEDQHAQPQEIAHDSSDTKDFATVNLSQVSEERPATTEQITNDSSAVTSIPQPSTTSEPTTSTATPPTVMDPSSAEDDPISAATATELLQSPGDACAICIDNLDDEDEVRGLTCGHAFHASCLDPWLTSRRACCPLCKADYYVPKPRAGGAAGTEGSDGTDIDGEGNGVGLPPAAFLGGRPGFPVRRVVFAGGRFQSLDNRGRSGIPIWVRDPRRPWERRDPVATNSTGANATAAAEGDENEFNTATADAESQQQHVEPEHAPTHRRWSYLTRRWRTMPGPDPAAQTEASTSTSTPATVPEEETSQATPGQLEAGTRTAVS